MPRWRHGSKHRSHDEKAGPPVIPSGTVSLDLQTITLPHLGTLDATPTEQSKFNDTHCCDVAGHDQSQTDSLESRVASTSQQQEKEIRQPGLTSHSSLPSMSQSVVNYSRPSALMLSESFRPDTRHTSVSTADSPQRRGSDTREQSQKRGSSSSHNTKASRYDVQSDFRLSPTAHAALTVHLSPQARRSMVEAARQKSVKKIRAATRLNVMVVGEAGTGKTLFLCNLAASLQREDVNGMDRGGDSGNASRDNSDTVVRPRRTDRLTQIEPIEVKVTASLLVADVVLDYSNDSLLDSNVRLPRNSHERRQSNESSLSSQSYVRREAMPARLKLSLISLIDTPGLPLQYSDSVLRAACAPASLREALHEINLRYRRTLCEEAKLSRASDGSTKSDGEHVHVVLWFIDPREILEGDRTWWYEEQQQKRWQEREQLLQRANGSSETTIPTSRRDEAHTAETHSTSHNLTNQLSRKSTSSSVSTRRPMRLAAGGRDGQGQSVPGDLSEDTVVDDWEADRTEEVGKFAISPTGVHATEHLEGQDYNASEYVPILSPSQRLALYHLLPLVPVLPVIARSETLTSRELEIVRLGVRRGWDEVQGRLRCRQRVATGLPGRWDWIGFGGQSQTDTDATEIDGEAARVVQIKRRQDSPTASIVNGHGATVPNDPRESPPSRRRRDLHARETLRTSDIRAALGVEDIVPPPDELQAKWPLALWAPDASPPAKSTVTTGCRFQQRDSDDQESCPAVERAPKEARVDDDVVGEEVRKDQARSAGDAIRAPCIVERNGSDDAAAKSISASTKNRSAPSSSAPSSMLPLGSNQSQHIPRTRSYPNGLTLDLLDPTQCDFAALRAMLLGTHTSRILDASREAFEGWRRRTLEEQQLSRDSRGA
ncbi:unnamed protein product [Jaminaea pallidilutea]